MKSSLLIGAFSKYGIFYRVFFKNSFEIKIENIYHGIKDAKEKIIPIVPKVEGIIIKTPAIKPMTAVAFPKIGFFNITQDISIRAMPFKI